MTDKSLTVRDSDSSAVMALLNQAVANGMSPDSLEKLVALQERILDRNAAQAFSDAMAAFQAELPPIPKRSRGYNGPYASLEDILRVVRPIMAAHGLSVEFDSAPVPETEGRKICVKCVISHRDGHKVERTCAVPIDSAKSNMNDIQRIGSSLSYAQRYALRLALALTDTGEIDDDGHIGGATLITEDQALNLEALADDVGANKENFLRYLAAASFREIKSRDYSRAIAALESKRRKQ